MSSVAEHWQSRIGFVMATIGAAVGLGSMWRFAYVVGENGGAAFMIIYGLIIALIALPLTIAEISLGRRGATDAVTTFEKLAPRRPLRWLGWAGVVGCIVILGYYVVIAGWALEYFVRSAFGTLGRGDAARYDADFQHFIASPVMPVVWQTVLLTGSGLVVAGGIQAGIERMNSWLMPLLAIITTALAVFAVSLPGAGKGLAFLFAPEWSAFLDAKVWLAALGQAFFSIGLGMSVFVTYGSYLGREVSIPGAATAVVVGDTVFSLIAGLAIFPAVFALGGDPAAGPRLAFVTFPQILGAMPLGWLVGPLFFGLLVAAAVSSIFSLIEVPTSYLVHRRGIERRSAVAVVVVIALLVGLPATLGYGALAWLRPFGLPILDAMDRAASDFLLPIAGLGVAILVGWVLPRHMVLADADLDGPGRLGRLWLWSIRWLAPLAIGAILLGSLGLLARVAE